GVTLQRRDRRRVRGAARFESGHGRLGGTDPLGELRLREAGARARLQESVDEGELVRERLVRALHLRALEGPRLEPLQRATHASPLSSGGSPPRVLPQASRLPLYAACPGPARRPRAAPCT